MKTRYRGSKYRGRSKGTLQARHNQKMLYDRSSKTKAALKIVSSDSTSSKADKAVLASSASFALSPVSQATTTETARAVETNPSLKDNLISLRSTFQAQEQVLPEAEILNQLNQLNQQEVGEPLRVLLISEGTYPFFWGGVSTWSHLLIRDLPEVNFILFSTVADPCVEPQINLPSNVVDFIPIPLWGVRETLELRPDLTMLELLRRKHQISEELIANEFVPLFRAFLKDLLLSDSEPGRLGTQLHAMYKFFRKYDFDTTFHSQAVWNSFVEVAQIDFPAAIVRHGFQSIEFNLQDVTQGLQWLYHWLFPLSKPIPKVDIAHASTAGISTMIGIIAKLEYGAGFLLSEHGIYLRERYLAEATSSNSLFLKLLALRFARRMTDLSYAECDQISPCCDYNQRWELKNGSPAHRLRTIYYGADADKFYAGDKPFGDPPVIVWVGRINPLKDVITLLKAAALVHEARPDIEFRLYGSAPKEDQPYYEECLALRSKLGLEETVNFAGYSSSPAVAYNEGDVVLLSSISEGFPFATLEAMLCGKPVVATAVGGLPEQIEGCGIVVEPRNPREMADALLTLMNNEELCATYGRAAREKALQEFSVHQSRESYLTSYHSMLNRPETKQAAVSVGLLSNIQAGVNESTLQKVVNGRNLQTSSEFSRLVALEAAPASDPYSNVAVLDTISQPSISINSRLARQLKLQLLTLNSKSEWEPLDRQGIHDLAEQVKSRDPLAIDYLEVTALLESMGVTDDAALQTYGAPDTFELAKLVLEIIRVEQAPVKLPELTPEPVQSWLQRLSNYAQGPITLLPGVVVLLIIQVYSLIGQWTAGQMLALSLGMSAGLLMTNGFIQAIMRRASICLSLGNTRAASKFLIRALGLAGVSMVVLALLVLLVTEWVGDLTLSERVTFCLAFLILSTIWLAGGPLILVRKQFWLGPSLTLGLATSFAIDRLASIFTNAHLVFGTISGFVGTIGLILFIEWRAFTQLNKNDKSKRIILPSNAYLLYEAAPYFVYGLLYVVLITVAHFLGWFGKMNNVPSQQWVITNLEMGLTLALPPLVLVGGVAERTLRLFWQKALRAQLATSGLQIERFNQSLLKFYYRQQLRYGLAVAGISLIFGLPVWLIVSGGALEELIGPNPNVALIFFGCGLIIYSLLGQGLFNAMFCITLARPGLPLKAVAAGTAVMFGIGLPLSLGLDFSYCIIAFAAGAATFVTVSFILTRRLLKSADYYYFATF